MKRANLIFVLSLLLFYWNKSEAQLSLLVGGEANMTTDCTKGANLGSVVNLTPPYQREWYMSPGYGGGTSIGLSYLLKKHHFFLLRLRYSYQVVNGKFGQAVSNNSPHSAPINSYYIQYEPLRTQIHSMLIPIYYGYSLNGKNNFFSFIPFVGWVNQFEFDGYYSGSIMGGLYFKLKPFYIELLYSRTLTVFNDEFSTIRLQTINLSIGYVYTFKTKAERQAKK